MERYNLTCEKHKARPPGAQLWSVSQRKHAREWGARAARGGGAKLHAGCAPAGAEQLPVFAENGAAVASKPFAGPQCEAPTAAELRREAARFAQNGVEVALGRRLGRLRSRSRRPAQRQSRRSQRRARAQHRSQRPAAGSDGTGPASGPEEGPRRRSGPRSASPKGCAS